jgi:hypothetical protein
VHQASQFIPTPTLLSRRGDEAMPRKEMHLSLERFPLYNAGRFRNPSGAAVAYERRDEADESLMKQCPNFEMHQAGEIKQKGRAVEPFPSC